MKTVSQVVEEIISGDPILRISIERGIVNYTRLAQKLRPAISRALGKEVSLDSVKMALIRYADRVRGREYRVEEDVLKVLSRSTVEVRTGISIITVRIDAIYNIYPLLSEIALKARFFAVMQSILAVTIALDDEAAEELLNNVNRENVISAQRGYAAIVIVSPIDVMYVPGVIAYISNVLALNDINIVHVESCYTDTILIVSREDLPKAFELLMKHLDMARTMLG